MQVYSGAGRGATSGSIFATSLNGGAYGCSGRLVFSSGSSWCGNTGSILLGTGASTHGLGGTIKFCVGSGDSGSERRLAQEIVLHM